MQNNLLILAYFGVGIAIYLSLHLLFRKTQVPRTELNSFWWGWLLSGDIVCFFLVPLLWPLIALLSILFWLAEHWHLTSKRKDEQEREAALERANKYSHMSMNELLAAQKQAAEELKEQRKENHAS